MELTLAVRRQVTAAIVKRWPKATRAERSQILDHLCAVTGWHRDHARKAIRQAVAAVDANQPPPRRSRAPVFTYGPEVVEALERAWAVSDGITGKRLAPFLADLVCSLRRHGELSIDDDLADRLCSMSAATIDRRLAEARRGLSLEAAKGRSLTKPGSMLKSQIPIRTWADWDEHRPGFLEIDLVGHEGGDDNDTFCWTLTGTDIATGWTETRSVRNKAARWVFGALVEIEAALPFALLGSGSWTTPTPSTTSTRRCSRNASTPSTPPKPAETSPPSNKAFSVSSPAKTSPAAANKTPPTSRGQNSMSQRTTPSGQRDMSQQDPRAPSRPLHTPTYRMPVARICPASTAARSTASVTSSRRSGKK